MPVSTTLQIRSKGTLTLPIELRREYGLREGDVFVGRSLVLIHACVHCILGPNRVTTGPMTGGRQLD